MPEPDNDPHAARRQRLRVIRIVLVVAIVFFAGASFDVAISVHDDLRIALAILKLVLAPFYLIWRT